MSTDTPGALARTGRCLVDSSAAVRNFLTTARSGGALPRPGQGETARRLASLRTASRSDPSVGRLVEAHEDALAILGEASVVPPPNAALAVWASGPTESVRLTRLGDGRILTGRRSFCGGASIVDAALVLCASDEGEQVVLVELERETVHVDPSTWTAPAFRDANICTVTFDDVVIGPEHCIGPPNWYGTRPGFWFGAVGIGALWAGIADALFDQMPELQRRRDGLSDLASATIAASMWSVTALLEHAGERIDGRGTDDSRLHPSSEVPAVGMFEAVSCRHAVRTHIDLALKSFDEEVGPAPYVRDSALAQLRSELVIALSQHHGARDLLMLQSAVDRS